VYVVLVVLSPIRGNTFKYASEIRRETKYFFDVWELLLVELYEVTRDREVWMQ